MERLPVRTGFDIADDSNIPELMYDVAAMLTELVSAALHDADTYRQLAGRKVIQQQDIALGIMRNVVDGSPFWTNSDMPSRCEQTKAALYDYDSSEEEDDKPEAENSDVEQEEWSRVDVTEDFDASTTAFVQQMNSSLIRFQQWNPTAPLLVALRNSTSKLLERL